jgi:hypothetical protein
LLGARKASFIIEITARVVLFETEKTSLMDTEVNKAAREQLRRAIFCGDFQIEMLFVAVHQTAALVNFVEKRSFYSLALKDCWWCETFLTIREKNICNGTPIIFQTS